ncbi:MAG: TraY domain-containing protein, partial [Boseongicola sp.]
MATKLSDEKKSHMVTIRMDRPMKESLDKAAKASGRSLSGEIQHRLTDYESLSSFVDRLLDDSVMVNLAIDLEMLRNMALDIHGIRPSDK